MDLTPDLQRLSILGFYLVFFTPRDDDRELEMLLQ